MSVLRERSPFAFPPPSLLPLSSGASSAQARVVAAAAAAAREEENAASARSVAVFAMRVFLWLGAAVAVGGVHFLTAAQLLGISPRALAPLAASASVDCAPSRHSPRGRARRRPGP
jgi:hypothetical protein